MDLRSATVRGGGAPVPVWIAGHQEQPGRVGRVRSLCSGRSMHRPLVQRQARAVGGRTTYVCGRHWCYQNGRRVQKVRSGHVVRATRGVRTPAAGQKHWKQCASSTAQTLVLPPQLSRTAGNPAGADPGLLNNGDAAPRRRLRRPCPPHAARCSLVLPLSPSVWGGAVYTGDSCGPHPAALPTLEPSRRRRSAPA